MAAAPNMQKTESESVGFKCTRERERFFSLAEAADGSGSRRCIICCRALCVCENRFEIERRFM